MSPGCRKGERLTPGERSIALETLCYWDNRKWVVYATVVMPDHIHALVQPCIKNDGGTFDLGEILHSVKSFSAHEINKSRKSKGPVLLDERFDRIVRDEAEFIEKWQYIRNNPVKNGLSQTPEEYQWLHEKSE